MDTPPSGMPSPPLSPHGTPSSLASDFPSLSGSMFSVIGADTPCDVHSDFESQPRSAQRFPLASGFSSSDHPDSLNHLILPSLTLDHPSRSSGGGLGLSRTASVGHFHSPLIRQLTQESPNDSSDVPVGGNMRLLVLGKHGAGKTLVCETLVQGLQPVEGWSYLDGVGRVLTAGPSASTVRITRADGWHDTDEPQNVVDSVVQLVQSPFHELDQVFHPSSASVMELSVDLLASAASPLYTAAILVIPSSAPSPTEARLIQALSQHLPVLLFSLHRARRRHSPDHHALHSRASSSHRPRSRQQHQPQYMSPLATSHSRAPSVPTTTTIEDEQPANTSGPLFTSHRAIRTWIFDRANATALRRESARKFFKWRTRERQVEALITPNLNLPLPPVPVPAFPIPSDAFERFTFDQLFSEEDFGGTTTTDTEAEGDGDESAGPPPDETDEESQVGFGTRGFTEHAPTTQQQEPEDRTWETDLSRMVALRKRQTVTRMETVRLSNPNLDPRNSALRQPLASIVQPPIPDYDYESAEGGGYFSEKGHEHDQLEHHHRRTYSSDAKYHDCESEESAMPPSTIETHASSGATGSGGAPAAAYDPLHLPSLFSLILSMLPDLGLTFWPWRKAGTHKLPTHQNDLGGSEKTMMMMFEVEVKDENEGGARTRVLSVPVIGVVCACAAAFCAGVAVGVRSGGAGGFQLNFGGILAAI